MRPFGGVAHSGEGPSSILKPLAGKEGVRFCWRGTARGEDAASTFQGDDLDLDPLRAARVSTRDDRSRPSEVAAGDGAFWILVVSKSESRAAGRSACGTSLKPRMGLCVRRVLSIGLRFERRFG